MKNMPVYQPPAERGVWTGGLQLGFQLQPLGSSSSQGIRQRQEISSRGNNLTETELGSTLVDGKRPPLSSHREERQKAHRERASALRLKQDSKAMWAAEEWPHGLFALVAPVLHPLGTDSKAGRLSTPYLHWRDLTPYWKRHCSSAS